MSETIRKFRDFAIEFISGAVAGVLMRASSHPFEYNNLPIYLKVPLKFECK